MDFKKTQKTPPGKIEKAVKLMNDNLDEKKRKDGRK